jgi:hypothetical protein
MAVNGIDLIIPTSIAHTAGSASINAGGSVTFTGVGSLSLNGVFSSAYDNYVLSFRGNSSGVQSLEARLRVSGTDDTAANYVVQFVDAQSTSITGARTTRSAAIVGTVASAQRDGSTIHIYGPNLSQPTAFRDTAIFGLNNATLRDNASTHSLSTSYDGITMFLAAGNFTGMISVYGLVK